jgi:hypothetical protein
MRRTPLWVFVAAVGVQLAALGLCLWVMERGRRLEIGTEDEGTSALPPAPPLSQLDRFFARGRATPPSQREPEPVAAREPEPVPALEPEAAPEPQAEIVLPVQAVEPPRLGAQQGVIEAEDVHEAPRPRAGLPDPKPYPAPRRVVIRAVQPPATPAPLFGPPPDRPPEPPPDANAVPRYITEPADAATQVMRGRAAEGQFAFGFYSDGNIRFVDADGGRYGGTLDSARARMREDGGTRAFTVQIGVAADGRLQAIFTGGPHDAHTFPLEPLAGWSAA